MADVKQYVNLDPTKPDQLNGLAAKRAGRVVKLEATVNPAEENVWVTFVIKNGANNVKNPNQVRRQRARTNANGKATIDLMLSEHGGDEFEVSARVKEDDNPLISDKYIVWRRIYYQKSRFDTGPKGANRDGAALPAVPALDLGAVTNELEARRHCIELVDDSNTDLITRRANVLTDENDSRAYKQSGKDHYDARREPVAMRIVLVNEIASSKTAEVTFSGVVKGVPTSKTLPHRLWVDESVALDQDWLIDVQWKWKWGSFTWHNLNRDCVVKTSYNKISLLVPDNAIPDRQSAVFAEDFVVRVKYRYLAGGTNGLSWYNAIWLASSNMGRGARSDDAKRQTAIHEIGHWLGMVPPGQKTQYTGRGHQGGHCSTGLSWLDRRSLSYSGLNGTCVMFGEDGDHRTSQFCAQCDRSVRKSKVQRDGMPGNWP